MNVIKEFKSVVKFSILDLIIFVIVFGYIDCLSIMAVPRIVSIVHEAAGTDTTLLMWIDIIYVLIYSMVTIFIIWFNLGMIHAFVQHHLMIGVSITLLEEGIWIQRRAKKAFIPNASITHIFCFKDKPTLFLVWNGRKGQKTFLMSKNVFGKESVIEADSILKDRKGYIDDSKQVKEIHKSIKKFHSLLLPCRNCCDLADGVEARPPD